MMKKQDLTPAEQEKERKKREAAWWRKVLVWYLNEQYHAEKAREEARSYASSANVAEYMHMYMRQRDLPLSLFMKKPGQMSPVELLEKMQEYEETDSPFRLLMKDLRESPRDSERVERALSRCVLEAPEHILGRVRRGGAAPGKGEGEDPEEAERARKEELRLRYEMTFLRSLIPPELFKKLCRELTEQGRLTDPDSEFLFVAEQAPERERMSYGEYTAMHTASPVEKDGKLGNRDEIFTAAAYQLAACEQRDEDSIDVKKADARAMEISGSRTFHAYMNGHPGSLLAAARGTGLDAIYEEYMMHDARLRARDLGLGAARDALRAGAGGRSAGYHRMVNALDRFLNAKSEPPKKEADALAMDLAKFVMTEGDPRNPEYRRDSCLQAAFALRALIPERDFITFLDTVNETRPQDAKLRTEEIIAPAAGAQRPREKRGPAAAIKGGGER